MKYNQMRQVVFPILAAFIWGTAFVAQDLCADSIGAFAFNATRYFIAVLALLVVILISDKVKKNKPTLTAQEKKAANKQLWLGGLCCGAALAIASNFQQAGLVAGTDAGKAGFITALYVVLVPVFGLFFKRKVSLPTWIAVVLSVVALYLLCIKGDFSLAPGDLLVLVCAVCFAVHILVIDHFTAYCDGVKLSCLQFLFAGIISTICMFIFEDVDFAAILSCALPLLYVGIFSWRRGLHASDFGPEGLQPHRCHHSAESGERVRRYRRRHHPEAADDRAGVHWLRHHVRRCHSGPAPVPHQAKSGIITYTKNTLDVFVQGIFYSPSQSSTPTVVSI